MNAFIVKVIDENLQKFTFIAKGISAEIEMAAREKYNALGLSVVLL